MTDSVGKLRTVERKLHFWPGVLADVIVVLHDTWKPADGEEAHGVTFEACKCHDWEGKLMIDHSLIGYGQV